ncbi:hypothetical protein niasHT_005711 [Heterodera trifolii]|uniref:Uncharacterized protein n=1 Tax=Heterodera trifolii TaxID=157864 RepID=A0ABD2LRW7_9BILA
MNSIVNDPTRGVNDFFFPGHLADDDIDETVDIRQFDSAKMNCEQERFFQMIRNIASTRPTAAETVYSFCLVMEAPEKPSFSIICYTNCADLVAQQCIQPFALAFRLKQEKFHQFQWKVISDAELSKLM